MVQCVSALGNNRDCAHKEAHLDIPHDPAVFVAHRPLLLHGQSKVVLSKIFRYFGDVADKAVAWLSLLRRRRDVACINCFSLKSFSLSPEKFLLTRERLLCRILQFRLLDRIVATKSGSKNSAAWLMAVILLRTADLSVLPYCTQICLKQFCDEQARLHTLPIVDTYVAN